VAYLILAAQQHGAGRLLDRDDELRAAADRDHAGGVLLRKPARAAG
jgi:hypothetical protein